MEIERAAIYLEALGHPKRLEVFRLLVDAGTDGLNFGQIQAEVGGANSTLSHHLSTLARAEMISQTRKGREIINRVIAENIRELVDFLWDECCSGSELEDE